METSTREIFFNPTELKMETELVEKAVEKLSLETNQIFKG
jgi:hypothetical protein